MHFGKNGTIERINPFSLPTSRLEKLNQYLQRGQAVVHYYLYFARVGVPGESKIKKFR